MSPFTSYVPELFRLHLRHTVFLYFTTHLATPSIIEDVSHPFTNKPHLYNATVPRIRECFQQDQQHFTIKPGLLSVAVNTYTIKTPASWWPVCIFISYCLGLMYYVVSFIWKNLKAVYDQAGAYF